MERLSFCEHDLFLKGFKLLQPAFLAYFLMMLETQVGREKMDEFLKTYFEKHKFQTLTTEEFKKYLQENFLEKYDLDIQTYLGYPRTQNHLDLVLLAERSHSIHQIQLTIDQRRDS